MENILETRSLTKKYGDKIAVKGGAMRGIFSAGVMDVMMENGIRFDGIVGVSAGAAFGVNYKSGQIGRAIRYNAKYCHDKRYCGIGSLFPVVLRLCQNDHIFCVSDAFKIGNGDRVGYPSVQQFRPVDLYDL